MGCAESQHETDNTGVLSRPHIFFLLGGPGAGKGTQAENLVKDYGFKHLSTGDLLREERQKGGELAETIDQYIKEGRLISSELVVKLLKKNIQANGKRRYLIDGFPRNRENWEEFEKQLADSVVIRNLLYFDCPNDIMTERIIGRSKTSGRSDDNPETIKLRLQTFMKETLPIVEKFEEKNNCIRIDATKTREEVYNQIKDKLSDVNVHPLPPANMLFVLGGPGAGKGTQCAILVDKYGFIHLSTGDLLREEVKSGSPLGKELAAIMKEGKLISSQLMVRIVEEQLEKNNYGGRYLLDGFPRGQENMDVWERMMSKKVNVKSAIYFECQKEELKRRLIHRGKSSGRSDDVESVIDKRLQVFYDNNTPVVEHYKKLGKLHSIDAMRPIEEVTQDLEKHLESMGYFPVKAFSQTTNSQ